MFGQVLKKARARKYPSAEKFAHKLAIEPHTYRKYERGETQPNFETLVRICEDLEITPNDLLPAVGNQSRRPQNMSVG